MFTCPRVVKARKLGMQRLLVVAVLVFASLLVEASARGGKGKKSILDYNEADVERIFQQWEVRTWHKFSLVPTVPLENGKKGVVNRLSLVPRPCPKNRGKGLSHCGWSPLKNVPPRCP